MHHIPDLFRLMVKGHHGRDDAVRVRQEVGRLGHGSGLARCPTRSKTDAGRTVEKISGPTGEDERSMIDRSIDRVAVSVGWLGRCVVGPARGRILGAGAWVGGVLVRLTWRVERFPGIGTAGK